MGWFDDFLNNFADFFTPESPQERARRNRSRGQARRRRRENSPFRTERRRGSTEARRRERGRQRDIDAPPPPDEPPPRRRSKYDNPSDDPYYQIYRQTAFKGRTTRPGFLEHKEIFDMYADALDWDEERRRNLWADYSHYMVSDRSTHLRKDPNNPFWQHSGISPDSFDWDAWRHAMGDSPRRK